jgi:hypothetical protein
MIPDELVCFEFAHGPNRIVAGGSTMRGGSISAGTPHPNDSVGVGRVHG